MPLSQTRTTLCPFCDQLFVRLGNHLPHCKQRCGREFSSLLAKNRVAPARSCRGTCPKCGRLFQRLDTHLRLSASCRTSLLLGPAENPHTPQINLHTRSWMLGPHPQPQPLQLQPLLQPTHSRLLSSFLSQLRSGRKLTI